MTTLAKLNPAATKPRTAVTCETDRGQGSDASSVCRSCVTWAVKYAVALEATYYLTLHIVSPRFREHVLDDLAVGYAAALSSTEVAEFAEYFEAYTERVERGLDPERLNRGEHMMEYRRVWTNHAVRLGERQLRQERRTGKTNRRRG